MTFYPYFILYCRLFLLLTFIPYFKMYYRCPIRKMSIFSCKYLSSVCKTIFRFLVQKIHFLNNMTSLKIDNAIILRESLIKSVLGQKEYVFHTNEFNLKDNLKEKLYSVDKLYFNRIYEMYFLFDFNATNLEEYWNIIMSSKNLLNVIMPILNDRFNSGVVV